jgi:ubiquinone/menaquinone biosynthesis C-methylase UbiE
MKNSHNFHGALTSPSVARNRDPILTILRRVLPQAGTVLEVASGTGEHAVHFAAALPQLNWQPTDYDGQALNSIAAHRAASGLANLLAPFVLDVSSPQWPMDHADAIVAINMVHISSWQATQGLISGAGRVLPPGGCSHREACSTSMEPTRRTAPIPLLQAMRPSDGAFVT